MDDNINSTELPNSNSEGNNGIQMFNKPLYSIDSSRDAQPNTNNCEPYNNSSGYNNTNDYNRISNNEEGYQDIPVPPVPNSSTATHLESNLNVIENQNNENLERDNEIQSGENEHEYEDNVQERSTNNEDCDTNDNLADSAPDFFDNRDSQEADRIERPKTPLEDNNFGSMNKSSAETEQQISENTQIDSSKSNEDIDAASTEKDLSNDLSGSDKFDLFDSLRTSKKPPLPSSELDSTLDLNAIDDIPSEPLLDSPEKTSEKTKTTDENIEFAHVSFDSNEKEHEVDKDASATTKDKDLDPFAHSSSTPSSGQATTGPEATSASSEPAENSRSVEPVEPVEPGAGADEDLTIILGTDREITQEERDAAASLPPLRELSDYPPPPSTLDTSDDVIYSGGDKPEEPAAPQLDIQSYISTDENETHECAECKEQKEARFTFKKSGDEDIQYLCDTECVDKYKEKNTRSKPSDQIRVRDLVDKGSKPETATFIRTCSSCHKVTDDIENNLTWEIMDFCNEYCLTKYQKVIGSKCASCQGDVKPASLGKYCVRFGNDIRQFCTSACLEEYKKGLKVCSYCQQDMSNTEKGFLAPVGEKGQFKDFCSKLCMEKYDIMTNDRPPTVEPGTKCSVCNAEKQMTIEFEHNDTPHYFCGEPCFVAFSFVNQLSAGKCAMCRRHFNKSILEENTMYYDNIQYSFCSNSCKNIYIIAHRKIVPCSWCKVKKYNFDMIKKYGNGTQPVINMCSINCLSLYKVSLSVINSKATECNFCLKVTHPAYHLTMSDASVRNFCSYPCVMSFQNQFPKQAPLNADFDDAPVPLGAPQKNKKLAEESEEAPPIPNVPGLPSSATTNGNLGSPLPSLTPISTNRLTRSSASSPSAPAAMSPGSTLPSLPSLPTLPTLPTLPPGTPMSFAEMVSTIRRQFIVKPPPPPVQRNAGTQVQPKKDSKGTSCKPDITNTGMQTEKEEISKILVPVPIPIYVPTPCHMFSTPVPVPVPFPLPIPIPIFIPTTRNSAQGIMKEIKKIQVKIPTDPYEAELLMMAEMVAEEKKEDNTDSESDLDDGGADDNNYSPEPVDSSNTFGDDMLQMALKMATELDEPAVDLEGALTANTITAPQGGHQEPPHQEEHVDDPQPMHPHMMADRNSMRGRKRSMRGGTGTPRGQSKRGRRMSHQQVDIPMHPQMQQPPPPPEPVEKPDANMCLKYTFGVNAWKQWVTTKNAELEKSSRRLKLFKTEILQLTADELNYSLCLFVKEVRKPNGQEYAPDTIYYLCLGIQQYLFENGRIDNIFCDPYYEKFTDCLDEVAKKFSVLYNDSHYIVTRVEEEHLWESKQLGAHSPHVLLSTLMFFNTKHFNLTTVDEHMQLSFSHIMKHWKRNPNQPGASKVPGSRNVLLRFYPPQSAIQNNQRKKKVYEQQENEENPLRCPVKLYEFYLSKCPESVKTRNDVFYLQPERSCVPDSPVWYSTMPLPKESLEKMLHRVKMVKEINVALLTS